MKYSEFEPLLIAVFCMNPPPPQPHHFSNMDETPTVWGINPKFLYLPINSGGRASAAESDDRSRFTTLVCIGADGRSLSPSFIIKCSTDNTDQTKLRVLDSLHDDPEFNTDNLWTKHMWTRTMEIRKKVLDSWSVLNLRIR